MATDVVVGRPRGSGVGVTSTLLAAIIATRWFEHRRQPGHGHALRGERGGAAGLLSDRRFAGGEPGLADRLARGGCGSGDHLRPGAGFMRDRPEDLGLQRTAKRCAVRDPWPPAPGPYPGAQARFALPRILDTRGQRPALGCTEICQGRLLSPAIRHARPSRAGRSRS